jgi:hypothetical protein
MPTENFKKLLCNLSNITDDRTRKEVEMGVGSFYCANVTECVPVFDKAPCEHVFRGSHNSEIVFGRDRNESWASGEGGAGSMQCGMIDLVAGRGQLVMAHNIKNNVPNLLEGVEKAGPMFHADAARVYITQKAENIDAYFGLSQSEGFSSEKKSAVAMKADHIRVIGREKVKIYCGQGNYQGFEEFGETNSLAQKLSLGRIELQVGSLDPSPVVLGDKLVKYLKQKNEKERKIYEMLLQINTNLLSLNAMIGVPGAQAAMIPFMKAGIKNSVDAISSTLNTYISEIDTLDKDFGIAGKNYILSETVFTT